jgi:hypothetical protein
MAPMYGEPTVDEGGVGTKCSRTDDRLIQVISEELDDKGSGLESGKEVCDDGPIQVTSEELDDEGSGLESRKEV